jgi:hypothetical protein
VHRLLTLAQLDELVKKLPALRNETAFVNAYLPKLAPENEVDLDADPAAREAYFERVWGFVKDLDPVHNSLKACVLYNRLRHDMSQGVYDRARFQAYVKLPRDVHYLNAEFRGRVPYGNQFAQLNRDFSLIALPSVRNEEPLVRDYLLAFFKGDADYAAFAPYLRDDFLKPLFAEAKIVSGVGDPQQWAPLLTPDAYKRSRSAWTSTSRRTNPALFAPGDAVRLTAFVKNVPSLTVKVYEINTYNYYRETGRPLNLPSTWTGWLPRFRTMENKEGAELRVARTFELPELKGRALMWWS